ncbi:MAG: archaeoflavoprotein AfpA [Promethearchaeota archaeon]
MVFRIIWGITGSGYLLKECMDLMKELQERDKVKITVALSKEGVVVVKWYKQWSYLNEVIKDVKVEKTPNNPWLAGPLQTGEFDFFLVCPVSANSLAKIAHGIADSLISNCVAQTIKGGFPVYLLPADQNDEPIITTRPDGRKLELKIRDIELKNIKKLKKMSGIVVFSDFSEVKESIFQEISKLNKNE